METFWTICALVFGAVVGSFLNVVIWRLPRDESIVFPASHCPHCGSHIRAYDNIPLLSFVFLRGKCRDCGHGISSRYPMVELTTGLVFAALHQKFGLTPALGVFCIFCAAMIAVFWIDLDHLIIPDAISLNGIPIGVAASITGAIPGMDWKLSLFGTVLGGAVLYVPAVLYEIVRGVEGLGGGDVKLLAMMGAFLGPSGVIFVLLLSSTLGSAAGLAALIARRGSSTTPIPYGPFLTVSAVAYLFVGDRVIDFFLRTIFDQAIR